MKVDFKLPSDQSITAFTNIKEVDISFYDDIFLKRATLSVCRWYLYKLYS